MSDLNKQDLIDRRKIEMLDQLFYVDMGAESTLAEIADLVHYFRQLLDVEEGLPENTRLCYLGNMVPTGRVGPVVGVLQYAVESTLGQDGDLTKIAYEDAHRALYCLPTESLANAAGVYKIVGKAICVMPQKLLEDDELCNTFLEEIKKTDGLHDENNLLQTILSFARKRDRNDIAISAIEFGSDMCKKFVVDNFDWIYVGAGVGFIVSMIISIGEIRDDHPRLEKLLERLSVMGGLHEFYEVGDSMAHRTFRCSRKFANHLVKWVLSNLSIVDAFNLRNVSFMATKEDCPQVIDELVRRAEWREIAYCRTLCEHQENRHYAQKALDDNVDVVPVALDLKPRLSSFDPTADNAPSIFATIGAIGLSEKARLRAVERIREAGELSDDFSSAACAILRTIITGHRDYKNATVEEAGKKALGELWPGKSENQTDRNFPGE